VKFSSCAAKCFDGCDCQTVQQTYWKDACIYSSVSEEPDCQEQMNMAAKALCNLIA